MFSCQWPPPLCHNMTALLFTVHYSISLSSFEKVALPFPHSLFLFLNFTMTSLSTMPCIPYLNVLCGGSLYCPPQKVLVPLCPAAILTLTFGSMCLHPGTSAW